MGPFFQKLSPTDALDAGLAQSVSYMGSQAGCREFVIPEEKTFKMSSAKCPDEYVI